MESATRIQLVAGPDVVVEGEPRAIEAKILAASRGAILELAWVTEAGSGTSIGVNPEHVVAIRPAASQEPGSG